MVFYREQKDNEIARATDFALNDYDYETLVIGEGGDFVNHDDDTFKIESGSKRTASAYVVEMGRCARVMETYWLATYKSDGTTYSERRLYVYYDDQDGRDEYSLDSGSVLKSLHDEEDKAVVDARVLRALFAIAEDRI